MKKLNFILFGLLVCLLASCGGGNPAERLLNSVPKDSKYIVVVRAQDLASKAFSDPDAALQLTQMIDSAGFDTGKKYFFSQKFIEALSSPIVIFENDYADMATFYVADPKVFRADFEQAAGETFTEDDGLFVLSDHTAFMKGDQVWLTGSYPAVKGDEILSLLALKSGENASSIDYVASMLREDDDVSLVVNVEALGGRFSYSYPQFVINLLFDDATYIAATVDFDEGRVESALQVLNGKFKPAKRSVNLSQIDTGRLSSFPGRGNFFFATAVDSKLMGKLVETLKKTFNLPSDIRNVMKDIEGNVIFSANTLPMAGFDEQYALMFSFNSEEAAGKCVAELNPLVSRFGRGATITIDGRDVCVKTDVQQGSQISSVAEEFRGATLGLVFISPDSVPGDTDDVSRLFRGLQITMKDSDKSAKIDIEVDTEKGSNSLASLIKLIKYLRRN